MFQALMGLRLALFGRFSGPAFGRAPGPNTYLPMTKGGARIDAKTIAQCLPPQQHSKAHQRSIGQGQLDPKDNIADIDTRQDHRTVLGQTT